MSQSSSSPQEVEPRRLPVRDAERRFRSSNGIQPGRRIDKFDLVMRRSTVRFRQAARYKAPGQRSGASAFHRVSGFGVEPYAEPTSLWCRHGEQVDGSKAWSRRDRDTAQRITTGAGVCGCRPGVEEEALPRGDGYVRPYGGQCGPYSGPPGRPPPVANGRGCSPRARPPN